MPFRLTAFYKLNLTGTWRFQKKNAPVRAKLAVDQMRDLHPQEGI